MKQLMKITALLMIAVVVFGFASCKPEVEYVDKAFTSAVTFTTAASEGTVTVTMTTATGGAKIYYTTNGTTPTAGSTEYTEAVSFTSDATLSAIAIKTGMEPSPVSTSRIVIADFKTDNTAPSNVTGLTATAKDSRVLLTWTDATDSDVYGYEVSYNGTSAINRIALPAMPERTMMVAPGVGGCYVSNLTNGTTYTFRVKTVDTSGNKSVGVTKIATPANGNTMSITLTQGDMVQSGNSQTVVVTVNITTEGTVIGVKWKKDGSQIAKTLLADSGAQNATVDANDNKKWTFSVNATAQSNNGTYTVAAIDSAGREETAQIAITSFNVTPDGFVAVNGATVSGAVGNGDTASYVFIADRTVIIPDMLVCDHEVTQAEFQLVMGRNPSYFNGSSGKEPATGETQANRPVESVSWYDALVYCNTRSIADGFIPCYTINGSTNPTNWGTVPISNNSTWNAATCNFNANGYRLPTQAEWEYIARGGNNGIPATQYTYSGSNTIGDVAWCSNTSILAHTHEVKKKDPNSLGIYDMSGNVEEWCWDWYASSITSDTPATGASSGSRRVFRGGSWNGDAYASRVATIQYDNATPHYAGYYLGFRVVRSSSTN